MGTKKEIERAEQKLIKALDEMQETEKRIKELTESVKPAEKPFKVFGTFHDVLKATTLKSEAKKKPETKKD